MCSFAVLLARNILLVNFYSYAAYRELKPKHDWLSKSGEIKPEDLVELHLMNNADRSPINLLSLSLVEHCSSKDSHHERKDSWRWPLGTNNGELYLEAIAEFIRNLDAVSPSVALVASITGERKSCWIADGRVAGACCESSNVFEVSFNRGIQSVSSQMPYGGWLIENASNPSKLSSTQPFMCMYKMLSGALVRYCNASIYAKNGHKIAVQSLPA